MLRRGSTVTGAHRGAPYRRRAQPSDHADSRESPPSSSKPVRRRNPSVGQFDSGAAPLRRIQLSIFPERVKLVSCALRPVRCCPRRSSRRSPSLATSARQASATCCFHVGDRRYPFIAIIEGEVAILDAAGNEIVRHGASGFLGEMNLLSGQTVFLTAVVTKALRYIAVDRDALRPLLFEDGP